MKATTRPPLCDAPSLWLTTATALSICGFGKLRQVSRKEKNGARKGVCTSEAHRTFNGTLQAECSD